MSSQTYEIRKLSQQYAYASLQLHEAIARKAGFAGTDHKYLGFLLQQERLSAGELADLTGLSTGAVTGLIDRFEQKQLVRRIADPHDRRKVRIQADRQKITALLAPFYQAFQDASEALIAGFSEPEQTVIRSYLSQALKLSQNTLHQLHQENKA